MRQSEPWIPDEHQLKGNLHHLRTLLDQPIPRVTTTPELARAAAVLSPALKGLEAILAVVQLTIDNLPDDRGPVAEHLYGLSKQGRGQKVRARRKLAMAEYEELTGITVDKYESFRTNAERTLVDDLVKVLVGLVEESDSPDVVSATGGPAGSEATDALTPQGAALSKRLPPPEELADQLVEQAFSFVDNLVSPRLRLLSTEVESTCDWLYGELLGYLVDVLGSLLVDFFRKGGSAPARLETRREGSHATRVLVDDTAYVIAVGTRPTRPYEVDVYISTSGDADLPPNMQLALGHEGRFVLASLALSPALHGAEPWAASAVRAVLDSGDRAIEAFVVSQLAFDMTGAVAQLYGLVQRYFPREIATTIRLFLLDPRSGGGMHLDHTAQQTTLASLRPDHGVEGISSAEKLLRLAVARFPVKDSVAAEIIPSMQTVVRSPLRIPSAREVGAIQHELFGHNLILQPLLNSDRLWIEAGYPASLRAAIEPVLEQHTGVIAERARELDFAPALQEPSGETFDLASARGKRREQFRKNFGHLIAGYPTEPS